MTLVVAIVAFHTAPVVALRASLAGVVASFPISLMVAASIFQMTFMMEVGAVKRIVLAMKSVSPQDRVAQILMINVGFGTLVTALGATPVSILPPIMIALGYSSYVAIALPAIGYDSLCTYALLAIPAVVYTDVLGPLVKDAGITLTLQDTGLLFARFIPLVTTCIALGMFWIVGRWRMMLRGLLPAILTGPGRRRLLLADGHRRPGAADGRGRGGGDHPAAGDHAEAARPAGLRRGRADGRGPAGEVVACGW